MLAVFSVPESERRRRHVLRSELTRLGFGMVAPGVWIVPAHPRDTTAETLRRLELDAYADLFRADHLAFGDPAAKIRRWWDLDELERQYESFIRAHEPALRPSERPASPGGPEAFAGYVRVLTDWRRLPYLDPGLPAELLPDGWVGIRAADLFFALRALLEEPARAYVKSASAADPIRTDHRDALDLDQRLGQPQPVTPTAAMAGYPFPASRRQTAPISLPCAW